MGKLISHRVNRGKGDARKLCGCIGKRTEKVSGSLAKNLDIADYAVLLKPVGKEIAGALAACVGLDLVHRIKHVTQIIARSEWVEGHTGTASAKTLSRKDVGRNLGVRTSTLIPTAASRST